MKGKLGTKTQERQSSLQSSLDLLNSDVNSAHSLDDDYSRDVLDQTTKLIDINEIGHAPSDWNVWSKISRVKQIEMMESFQRVGMQHNVVIWKVSHDYELETGYKHKYMMLSGHNRLAAYRELLEVTGNIKYNRIRSYIHYDQSMSPEKLISIIDDTNEIGRAITAKDRANAIKRRYIELKTIDASKTERSILSAIGDDENKEYRQIKRYYDLNKLIEPFLEMVGDSINIKSGVALSRFTTVEQEEIYNKICSSEKYAPYFINKHITKLKKQMRISKIIEYFDGVVDSSTIKYRTVELPDALWPEVQIMIAQWKKKNKS